jgi:hypothetical protein
MPVCDTTNISTIYDNECLGDSLSKINNNFLNLEASLSALRFRTDSKVEIRTFFYYGPNAQSDPRSGMADNQTSRPSDMTIMAFVNSPTQLNLPTISKPNDVAYVIYQKTGFLNSNLTGITTDYMFGDVTSDVFNQFAPTFVIWKLTCQTSKFYTVDAGFPKITRAQTDGNVNTWNQPQLWNQSVPFQDVVVTQRSTSTSYTPVPGPVTAGPPAAITYKGGIGKCWVAQEVYGIYNIKWIIFRDWLYSEGPYWLQNTYNRYSEGFASWISDKPVIKTVIRKLMDIVVNKRIK